MTYQQPYPSQYPQQQYPPPPAPARPKPAGFAVTALVLGIVGVVLSFMPIVNNLTAAGAVVGLVFGMIGLWKSRIVMSAIGAFLCGLALILTVLAQQQLADDLDKIGDDLSQQLTPTAAVADSKTTVECANVERAYNAWHWEPTSSADWSAINVDRRLEDGENFLTAIQGYTGNPALSLAVAISEYNLELSLLAVEFELAGSADTSTAESALAGVNDAYGAFHATTCN